MWRFLISQWRDNETKYLRGSKGDSPKLIERVRRHNVGHSFLLSSNNGKISLALLCFLSFTWILGTRGSTILCWGGTTTSHSKYLKSFNLKNFLNSWVSRVGWLIMTICWWDETGSVMIKWFFTLFTTSGMVSLSLSGLQFIILT